MFLCGAGGGEQDRVLSGNIVNVYKIQAHFHTELEAKKWAPHTHTLFEAQEEPPPTHTKFEAQEDAPNPLTYTPPTQTTLDTVSISEAHVATNTPVKNIHITLTINNSIYTPHRRHFRRTQ